MKDNIKIRLYEGHKHREANRTLKKIASDKAWSLLCNIEYLLQERDSKTIDVSKHMLDMTLGYISHEIHAIYELLNMEDKHGQ